MSQETFSNRIENNKLGTFYVSWTCLDCDLCWETAPTIFARNDEDGSSYVAKQPETKEEHEAALEAMEGCCTESIFNDGDEHDWSTPPEHEDNMNAMWTRQNKPCCGSNKTPKNSTKPWWKFWK